MPTNLLDWQRVSCHLPEVKYIFGMGFWGGRYTNSIGVAEIPLRPLAVTLGLDPAALESGIKTLCSESLLVGDFDRFEFFISDWFRFHTFRKTGIAIARKQFLKTGSANLRNALLKAAPWLGGDNNLPCQEKDFVSKQSSKSPTAAATSTYSAAAEKIRIRRPSGIVTFTATDGFVAQISLRPSFPLHLTDLWHSHRNWRAELSETVKQRSSHLKLGDLAVEITCHNPFAQEFEAAHFGLDQAAPVVATPLLPDGPPQSLGCLNNFVSSFRTRRIFFP